MRAESISDYGTLFDFVLPLERLRQGSRTLRERLFPEVVTFWAWVSQIMEGNGSCAKAVTLIQGWYEQAKLPLPSVNTSSFCRARQRLSDEFLNSVDELIHFHSEARLQEYQLWRGHRLKAIDGTSFQLMDTPENQEEYPQPSGQVPGCGFPVMSMVAVLDLATGRLTEIATGRNRKHDAKGLYELSRTFSPGDVVIADRAYCSYELITNLFLREVDSVMRLHQKREGKLDWRRGRRLDAHSRIVTWTKGPKPGKCGTTLAEWEQMPDTMQIRLVRVRGTGRDGKMRTVYLATTLLDPQDYPSNEIADLYEERWKIEVKFRDIKTTLGFEMLRVKTPEMARKALRMIQITYNLIKSLHQEVSASKDIFLDELGFKGTVDVLVEFRVRFRGLQNRPRLLQEGRTLLEERIAERILNIRLGRIEHRAVKRRPKSYQLLTKPRPQFVEVFHRTRYYAVA